MRAIHTVLILCTFSQIGITQIYVKYDAAGANDGSSWENAFVDLQDALDTAIQGEQIWISSGAYKPTGPTPDSSHFYTETGVELYGGFSGNEVMLDDRDWEANPTIISGDLNGDDVEGDFDNNRNDNAHHVFYADIISGTIVLDGLTFEGGTTILESTPPVVEDYKESTPWHGGGALVYGTSIIRNCTFRDNDGFRGSGLFAYGNDHVSDDLNVDNCLFENNNSVQGGFRVGNFSDPLVENCIFSNNLSRNFGSALTLGNSNATIRYCDFENNFSESLGPGVSIFQNTGNVVTNPMVKLISCSFMNNSTFGNGGAIWYNNFYAGAQLIIDSSYFTQNEAGTHGGGLFTQNLNGDSVTSLNLIIRETLFTENFAQDLGGAIVCYGVVDTFNIDLSNSLLQSNACAGNEGGGLWIGNSSEGIVSADLQGVRFIDNFSGDRGGGLYIGNENFNERMHFEVKECSFDSNLASGYGGAIASYGCIGSIAKSSFNGNFATGSSGALDSGLDFLTVDNCVFTNNWTQAEYDFYNGGGAILGWLYTSLAISNCIFENNDSEAEGGALFLQDESTVTLENILFHSNTGNSTIYNPDTMRMTNVTMIENENGIFVSDDGYTWAQNCVFDNLANNLLYLSAPFITSYGSNISSDATLTEFLTGYNNYQDYHETDPLLGPDFVPLDGSLCIDRGNPDGISTMYDVAGNDRIQGGNIDIGAFESSFVSALKDVSWNNPDLQIFPNPASNQLRINMDFDWNGNASLLIFDALGNLHHQEHITKSPGRQYLDLKLQHLAQGQYFLVLEADTSYGAKLLIQRH